MKLRELKKTLFQILTAHQHSKSPEAEADQILFQVLKSAHPEIQKPSELYFIDDTKHAVTEAQQKAACALAEKRSSGIPLQHLLQIQFFNEHEYFVNESVLIPRPETEILIREVIQWAKVRVASGQNSIRFAELGLGSGILSCELLAAIPQAIGTATEVSPPALAVALHNLEKILGQAWKKRFIIIDNKDTSIGFEVFSGEDSEQRFDLVISNPPYVSNEDEVEDEVYQYEPHLALFPDLEKQPNYFYENFCDHFRSILKPNGAAFFEVPHERALEIEERFKRAGFSTNLILDLTERPRVLVAKLI